MVSQQIIDYIDKTRKAGYSDTQIRETLKKTGWGDKDINEAMGVKEQIVVPQPLPNSPEKPVASEQAQKTNDNKKTNTLAIISLICSFIVPLIGLILGIVAKGQIKKTNEGGKGLATAAIVISIVFMVIYLLMILTIPFMAYFGVLSPSRLLPDRCEFPPEVTCIDTALISSSDITIALRNNIGFPILVERVESIQCNGETQIAIGDQGEFTNLNNNQVNNNEKLRIKLTGCNNGKIGQKVQDTIDISYKNTESELSNTASGNIRGSVS